MKDKYDIGLTNLIKHEIITTGPTINLNPRRQPIHLQPKIDKNIQKLLEKGIIRECESQWNTPLVCAEKKDTDDIRMCLDFRQLNKIAQRPIFPIPNVDEIFDSMGKAQYFSTIDLGQAYYQVELTEESKLKTAFSTKTKQYCFNRMPFGIAAAPATFQRLMNKVIDNLNWKVAITYLDDIIVFSSDKEQHYNCLLYTSPSPRDGLLSRMPSSA